MAARPKLFKQGTAGGVTDMSSFVSTSLQEGQWKMSFSGRTPSFGIVGTYEGLRVPINGYARSLLFLQAGQESHRIKVFILV
jgi:hypothetical protein